MSRAYLDTAVDLAKRRGLATHLDGARLFNAATKLGITPREVCRGFDSVSVCLSKGLGTPAGTMLAGSQAFIKTAHRMRKMLGGAMRQAGVIAAAGLYAIEHNITRIADDHANAERLARGLSGIAGLNVEGAQTNMVFVRVAAVQVVALNTHMQQAGVRILAAPRIRLVTHLDVDANGIDRAISAFKSFFVK